MSGVANTLKFFQDLSQVVQSAVSAGKAYQSGGVFAVIGQVAPLLAEVSQLVVDAKGSLPELKDLDASDALQVGAAAYSCVLAIVAAA